MTLEAFQLIKLWIDIVQFVSLVLVAVGGVFLARIKVNKTAIDRVDARVSEIAKRIERCDNELLHMPGHEDLGLLHEKINRVDSSLQGLRGEMTGINATLKLIHQAMLEDRSAKK